MFQENFCLRVLKIVKIWSFTKYIVDRYSEMIIENYNFTPSLFYGYVAPTHKKIIWRKISLWTHFPPIYCFIVGIFFLPSIHYRGNYRIQKDYSNNILGYGNIVPATIPGRMFCIGFGLVGIPLFLIFIANIGDAMADACKYAYRLIICVISVY